MQPRALYTGGDMRSLVACAALALIVGVALPRRAHAQVQRVAVIPLVFSDTADQRLATSLRDALERTPSRVKVTTKRDIEWILTHTEGPDTLSSQGLREVGHLMNVHVVVGVHRCDATRRCVVIVADRIRTPSSPDTLWLQGPDWVQAARDTLELRFFRNPSAH